MEGNKTNKSNKRPWLSKLLACTGKIKLYAILAAIILVAILTAYIIRSCQSSSVAVSIDDKIDITPTQVLAMKEIGEWEFLSIEDEEMIDTVRKGIFKDDELIRIYSGTLRLGIDLNETDDNWITTDNGTLKVTLPKIKLLDEDFIDEAKTQAFIETGRWSDKARDDMYHRAREKMKRRCLTKENIKSAENNAVRQFYQMFKAMGFENIEIRIKDS